MAGLQSNQKTQKLGLGIVEAHVRNTTESMLVVEVGHGGFVGCALDG
jgi:hypothetical protein